MGGHDGIYAGEGMILHAPYAGSSVRIQPIWTEYRIVRLGILPDRGGLGVGDSVGRAAVRNTAACVLGLNVTHPINPDGRPNGSDTRHPLHGCARVLSPAAQLSTEHWLRDYRAPRRCHYDSAFFMPGTCSDVAVRYPCHAAGSHLAQIERHSCVPSSSTPDMSRSQLSPSDVRLCSL